MNGGHLGFVQYGRPRREPSLAPAKNQKYMTLATSGLNLVLVERFEQCKGKYWLSPLTIPHYAVRSLQIGQGSAI